jgi:hypothetical protein
MPRWGNDEASGSPCTSSWSEKPASESCFSAVEPVSGWNQRQKCVAPLSIAQSFIAPATTSARSASSAWP